ncbi:tetratricopeptide repeat protein [Acidipila rosea]|uniref:Tetratricopeptide repeat protein n=1 Tax=Acidipila rosea TaxID=768535 RepID=A0A4R1LCC8_9BACT|nr:hypothetical protein [Acidipila rosea]TCK76005.1 hypothetical protein C7378_1010 [Acidipila rosea]
MSSKAPYLRRFLLFALFLLPLQSMSLRADTVDTDPLNRTPEVREAFARFYLLDYDGAVARFENIRAAHPGDPLATAYVLHARLFRELYRLDLLDTTFYANDGFLTGKHTVVEDPKVRDEIKALSDQSVNEANALLKNNSNNIDALFARGWARSLDAVYLAMVERNFGPALRMALGARSDHDKVLQLDPRYDDAKMVVGIYQYVIGALPFGFKLLVGFAGITGSKTKGMELLQDAANHAVLTSVEARTAMMLFLRREAKYPQAQQMARDLSTQYPHDFLFLLEDANLEKDAGQGLKAIGSYQAILLDAKKPGFFYNPHLELAYFGLGDTLRGQNMYGDAAKAFLAGSQQPTTSPELKRRCLLAAGQTYDLMHDHTEARVEYQAVLANGANTVQGDQAKKFLKTPYSNH